MELKSMMINRVGYGTTEGELRGKVTFVSKFGEIELALDNQLSSEIVGLCADGIARASKHVAEQMTAEVIVALPAPSRPGTLP